jgi:hypothetical protein
MMVDRCQSVLIRFIGRLFPDATNGTVGDDVAKIGTLIR